MYRQFAIIALVLAMIVRGAPYSKPGAVVTASEVQSIEAAPLASTPWWWPHYPRTYLTVPRGGWRVPQLKLTVEQARRLEETIKEYL